MEAIKIEEYARELLTAHGDKAEAEAAHRLKASEEKGDFVAADIWRKVRAAIAEHRGPHSS